MKPLVALIFVAEAPFAFGNPDPSQHSACNGGTLDRVIR